MGERIRPGLLVFLVGILLYSAGASAGDNLLHNPNLDQGSGDQPSYWRIQRLVSGGGSFTWVHNAGFPGELRINNRHFDVAQWAESIALAPGWYRLNGEIETTPAARSPRPRRWPREKPPRAPAPHSPLP